MSVPKCCRKLFTQNKTKKTIYQCFNPVLQISALGGMCTVAEYRNSYVLSYGLVGFQILIILLNAVHLVLLPNGIIYFEKQNQELLINNSKQVFENFDFITKTAKPLLISLSTLILRLLNLVLLHRNLPKIFRKIEIAKRAVDFKDINCKDYAYAKFLISLILILSIPYQIFSLHDEYEPYNTVRFIIFAFNHYNNFSAVCLDIQFSYVCYILKNRFKIVNDHLKKHRKVEAFESNEKHIRLWNYEVENQLKAILDLRDCHHTLCECCEHLNKLYNIQLLITLTNCLINVLLNLYFAIYGGFGAASDQLIAQEYTKPPIRNIIKQTIWGLYYFIRFADICAIAESLSKEANLTKVLICDLLANCTEKNVKDMLWIFHAYTISSEIKFTAFGFFNIDLSLISSAVSAGTTYLVILAQFHGQKHSGQKL